jgi:hypothetical protein
MIQQGLGGVRDELVLTAMIWRTERRTVVAAMVGGNCNMDETLEAICAEVTIQSNALLPVLRLMALRAMKNTVQRLERQSQHSISFMSFRVGAASRTENLRAVKAGFKGFQ